MPSSKRRSPEKLVPGCQSGAKTPILRLPGTTNRLISRSRMGGRAVEGTGLENRDHPSRAISARPDLSGFPPRFEPRSKGSIPPRIASCHRVGWQIRWQQCPVAPAAVPNRRSERGKGRIAQRTRANALALETAAVAEQERLRKLKRARHRTRLEFSSSLARSLPSGAASASGLAREFAIAGGSPR
jgi:hypothetical protein